MSNSGLNQSLCPYIIHNLFRVEFSQLALTVFFLHQNQTDVQRDLRLRPQTASPKDKVMMCCVQAPCSVDFLASRQKNKQAEL